MALSNTTKMANRFGLDLEFYAYVPSGELEEDATPVAVIDFANEISLEITGENVWATGGQAHANMIGFKDPSTGTLSISTQVQNLQILKLISNEDPSSETTTVSFKNDVNSLMPKYYIIKGKTVWQGEDGTTYNEDIIAYKASIQTNYNPTYNGSGDPATLEITFELGTNDNDMLVDIKRSDVSAA